MPKVGMEPIRRAEAINAALECICEHGIDKTTLDMVAARAGFSKGIVAYYFKSKKQLVVESLKAFLSSYRQKIGSSITADMPPLQMLGKVVEISLPPLDEEDHNTINVSILDGMEKIRLPQEKIAKLFIQFISKAANDEDLKKIVKEIYAEDVKGIAGLIRNAKKANSAEGLKEDKAAYALLAMIYGLSFFRVSDFMLPGENHNRDIAFGWIDHLFG